LAEFQHLEKVRAFSVANATTSGQVMLARILDLSINTLSLIENTYLF